MIEKANAVLFCFTCKPCHPDWGVVKQPERPWKFFGQSGPDQGGFYNFRVSSDIDPAQQAGTSPFSELTWRFYTHGEALQER